MRSGPSLLPSICVLLRAMACRQSLPSGADTSLQLFGWQWLVVSAPPGSWCTPSLHGGNENQTNQPQTNLPCPKPPTTWLQQ